MKILIITYYKELNPGTFLQAYGVQYAWRKKYPEAEIEYLNYSSVNKSFEYDTTIPNAPMTFLQKVIHVINNKRRLRKFTKAQENCFIKGEKVFSLFPNERDKNETIEYLNQYDIISVGSDTILELAEVDDNLGIMWVPEVVSAKKVFFAASGDSCNNLYKDSALFERLSNIVSRFSYIGIRDNVTINFLNNELKIPSGRIIKQPDPTFFLPLNLFHIEERKVNSFPKNGKTVFYHFDRRFTYRKDLANILKANGYYLVTTEYDPDADCSLGAVTPFEFAAIFKHVDYVLTERFHDTVFSMRWQTPVITVDWRKTVINTEGGSKRLSILEDFGCTECHLQLFDEDDLPKAVEKLKTLDIVTFKKNAANKVKEFQNLCDDILNWI